ncbi:MAG: hypothetical protein JWQ34_1846 [Mucilaginibacter sp.]|uniref:hypothetical protein n=1 Tax=Mucilaginibacter sp. TaxID=1882438 RepID=UPI002634F74B|nr:hypothetical protein [Mucilaginibacter sp.]MDB5003621.1 hypothetical protein [Mucilaginibacter sp.]
MIKLQKTRLRYVLPIMLLYGILSLAGILHHEIFLEEAQQLTIGRDSNSVIDVFNNMLYEGHVTLWNTFLFLITHYISSRPIYMQLFHLLVINSAVFIFLRYAPFNLPVKTLIVFGCYFLFVYSIVSRNYALGILLLFICCVLMANPEKNMVSIGILLLLMCFTHLFYVFASIGIFVYLFLYTVGKKKLYGRFALFTCLFLIGLVCAFFQTRRIPGDSIVQVADGLSWFNVHDLSFAISCFARGYITVPPLHQQYFWDKQSIQYLPQTVTVISALLLFAITILFLYKSKKALLFYLPPVALLTAFFAMSRMGGSRYFGMFVIFFIAALWLAYYDGVVLFPKSNISPIKKWAPRAFIYIILINQFFTGVYMYCLDFKQPFSQAKNTINYLKSNHLTAQPLAFDGYNAGPPLSAYLERKIFYLDINQYGSFCIWKHAYLPYPRRSLMDEISSSHYINSLKEFILITNRKYGIFDNAAYSFNKLASFEGAVIEGEDYYIYRVVKK